MEKKELKKLRKETIKKLEEVKNNLGYDMEENYCNMINTMIDYDNEAQDDLYLDDMTRELVEFVDDEILPYYVDYQVKTFGIDRYFYMFNGVNNVCGLYVVDGYGNLRDIEQSDLEYCIDEAITTLKNALNEEREEK